MEHVVNIGGMRNAHEDWWENESEGKRTFGERERRLILHDYITMDLK